MKVYHYTDKVNLDSILHSGLKTTSKYESFTELRKNDICLRAHKGKYRIISLPR